MDTSRNCTGDGSSPSSPVHIARQLVVSGNYLISPQKTEILEAYLGTCVGVTLCDREAGVGGLIHLLLAEPTSSEETLHPEKYASSGLPLFIRAMCRHGASRERLEACVAGGALVGPISEVDLALDVGGRTLEVVEEILRREKIPILQAETGGFFTCRLSLDLDTWDSHIEPVSMSPPVTSRRRFIKPTPEELDQEILHVRPIPQIVLKIIRMIADSRHGMKDIGVEIRKDQVISAKVIRLCNSAFVSRQTPIDSVDRALVILGEKRLLQVVVSASMEDFFLDHGQGYSLCKGGLFRHALGSAMICARLAQLTGKVSADIAYTAGLLHDIGKVVLDQYIAKVSPLFYRRIQMEGHDLVGVEQETFGCHHAQVGRRLAEHWSLPLNLTEAIGSHHHPDEAAVMPELTYLVYLADLIMSRFMVGQEVDRLNTHHLTSTLEKVGLSSAQFPSVVDRIPNNVFDIPLLESAAEAIEV